MFAKIEAGTITLTPQDDTQATKFGRRRPKDGLLDFSKDAVSLYNLIRGVTHPFPGAFTYVNNKNYSSGGQNQSKEQEISVKL